MAFQARVDEILRHRYQRCRNAHCAGAP
jgi:hypothetical protein